MGRKDTSIYDAIVLGGGPAGATAALMLARAGLNLAVVEKSPFPRRKVCGDFVSAPALSIVAELGLQREFHAMAGPEVRKVALFEGKNVIEAPMPRAKGIPFGKAMGREHLDQLLLDSAARAGARLWQPWQTISLEHRDGVWQCLLRNQRETKEIRAPLAIVATGPPRHSGGENVSRGHERDLLGFKAYYRGCSLPSDVMALLVFPGGYGGMVNSSDGLVSLSCCLERRILSQIRPERQRAGDAVGQHILSSCEAVREMLARADLDGHWHAVGPVRPGIRKAHADNLYFVGSAAGEPHPIVAEGIGMAIQSSWLLCSRLIASGLDLENTKAKNEVGRAFQAEWSAAFALRIRAAALFAELALNPATVAVARPVMKIFPGLLGLGAIFSGKSKICEPVGVLQGSFLPLE
jgi:flavin-dependent dehydrogenase